MEFKIQLKKLRKALNRKQLEFGEIIGHTQRAVSELETGKRNPTKTLIKHLKYRYGDMGSWDSVKPYTDKGEIILKKKVDEREGVGEQNSPYIYKEEDTETAGLLSMTREILESYTDYSASLTANIRSFHHAIKTEKRLLTVESRLEVVEKHLKEISEENIEKKVM